MSAEPLTREAMRENGAEVEYRALVPGRELAVVARIVTANHRGATVYALYFGEARGRAYKTLDGALRAAERRYRELGATSAYWRVLTVRRTLVTSGEVLL